MKKRRTMKTKRFKRGTLGQVLKPGTVIKWGVSKAKARREATREARNQNARPFGSFSSFSTTNEERAENRNARQVRPHVGFTCERDLYRRLKPDLLRTIPDKFVVLVGSEIIGPFLTFREAHRAGYAKFGPGPLFIRQVLAEEPAAYSGATVESCRS